MEGSWLILIYLEIPLYEYTTRHPRFSYCSCVILHRGSQHSVEGLEVIGLNAKLQCSHMGEVSKLK